MKSITKRYPVCILCLSVGVTDPTCECLLDPNHLTVELDYEVCEHCDNVISDGIPAETEHNKQILEELEREKKEEDQQQKDYRKSMQYAFD